MRKLCDPFWLSIGTTFESTLYLSNCVILCRGLSRNIRFPQIEKENSLCYSFLEQSSREAVSLETITLLIADSSDTFRSALTNAFQGTYRTVSCRTGKEALDLLQQTCPDVMILDLMLPELDGISLLQTISVSGSRPTVLATTRLANDYVIEAATKLGVEYLMLKPCDIGAIVSRVKDLSRKRPRPAISAPDTRTHISNLLISLGISTKLRGYPYLREAILLEAGNPLQSVTKELYPRIARQFECNSAQVERSIRNAIQSAWSQRNNTIWAQVFQPDETGAIPRPTNACFISRLADRILLDQLEFVLPK